MWHQARSTRRSESTTRRRLRGATLLEALVFLVIISVTVSAFTLAAAALLRSQRDQHGLDIASEAAHGQIEKAKSLPWASLGFLPSDPGLRGTFDGHPTVTLAVAPAGERLTPLTHVTVKGTSVDIRTDITWLTVPPANNPEYGTKQVTVTVTWQPTGSRAKTFTFTEVRSAHANEAPPTPLPTDFGTPAPPVPTPTVAPEPTATAGAGDPTTDPGGDW